MTNLEAMLRHTAHRHGGKRWGAGSTTLPTSPHTMANVLSGSAVATRRPPEQQGPDHLHQVVSFIIADSLRRSDLVDHGVSGLASGLRQMTMPGVQVGQ